MPLEPSSSREPNPTLSWEGDRMFNIYIYDYCFKRGFKKTARELMHEAHLVDDTVPPINARQGLLFEWWSVFWVLFQAKSGNSTHEDAQMYHQHQNASKAQRMQAVPGQPGGPLPLGNHPPQSSSNPQSQPQAPMRGMPNGMPMQRQPPPYHANGAMPNGINPAMGGHPAQPGQMAQPMQGQSGGPLNFGGIGGQPNGVPVAQQPPPQGGSQQPGAQAMSFNPMMSGPATQRPPLNGQPPQSGQQRGPFTSPPMAHSPQGGAGGSQGLPGQPGPQAPMAQLGGPSPQMTPINRSMLPPNGAPGPMNLPNPQQGAPLNTTFNPGQGVPQGQGPNPAAVRPPSRSRPTPSPSMSARQPPGAAGPQQGGMGMMMTMGPMQGMPGMSAINIGGMPGLGGNLNPDPINHEYMQIPNITLTNLKRELGFEDKDLGMNINDKLNIVNLWKQRGGTTQPARKDGVPGMLPPGQLQPQQGLQIQQRPQQPQQPGPTNRLKRNSTSPSGEQLQNDLRSESSPPDRKRLKRSPAEPPAVPPGYPQHSQSGQPSTPQQTHMPLNSQPGQPGPGMPPQPPMLQQQMMRQQQMGMPGGSGPASQGKPGGPTAAQPPTGPQPVGMPLHPPQMHPPQQSGLFRGGPPGPAAVRSSGGPQFHPTPLTHIATKPHIGMPASSPGMNGPPKDGAKDGKPPQSNGQPQTASPRNTTTGTAPPTPGASHPTPGLPPTSLPPPTPAPGGPNAQTPTQQQPPAMPGMLSMPMNISGMGGMNPSDFMFETTLMEEFDGDISFDREFGHWFNTTEDGAGLELK